MKIRELFKCWNSNEESDQAAYGGQRDCPTFSRLGLFKKTKTIPFSTTDFEVKGSPGPSPICLISKKSIDSDFNDSGVSSCPTYIESASTSRNGSTDWSSSATRVPLEKFDDLLFYHSDGIHGTNVSLNDLQELFFATFGPSAVISDNITFKILGDGAGFNSKVVKADNIWPSAPLAEMNGWPMTMAIKLATLEFIANSAVEEHKATLIGRLKKFYDVEIAVYSFLKINGRGRAIKMYGCESLEKRNKGILLLEYVDNGSYLELWEDMPEEDLLQVIREVAFLHAYSPKIDPIFYEANECFLNNVFFKRLSDEELPGRLETARAFLKDDVLFEQLKSFSYAIRPFAEAFYKKADELGLPKVFGHADLWSGNLLYQNGKYRSVIDLQTCHFLHIGAEFGRFFAYMASTKDRENVNKYLKLYLTELKRLWPGNQVSEEAILTSWELLFPFHYLISIFTRTAHCMKHIENEKIYTKVKDDIKELLKEAVKGFEAISRKYDF